MTLEEQLQDAYERAAELAAVSPAGRPPQPTPRPHRWVYTKELEVMYDGGGKPWIHEH